MSYVGFFCCPANPQPRRIKLQLKLEHLHNDYYRLRFFVLTHMTKAIGGIIPSKSNLFIRYVDPISPPQNNTYLLKIALSFYQGFAYSRTKYTLRLLTFQNKIQFSKYKHYSYICIYEDQLQKEQGVHKTRSGAYT